MFTYTKCTYFRQLLNSQYIKNQLNYKLFPKNFRRWVNPSTCVHTRDIHTSNIFHKRRKTMEEKKTPRIIEYTKSKQEIVDVWHNITINELSKVLNTSVQHCKDLFLNQIRNSNEPITDIKLVQEAVKRNGKRIRIIAKPSDPTEEKVRDVFPRPPPEKSELKPRPPVVTVMGHVDHGKTTLLDALRHSSVVDQEFGGITQHIGAFSVVLQSGARITFLDTPGHAAFSAMRARGANATDLVVLVVAADDGVMEQTVESVRMAKQANVPILVAINKIDAPKADVDRTENMLLQVGIQVERLGGDVQAIPISALKKTNLEHLTEALVLQADLMEIGGDPAGAVEAVVVESKSDQYRGKLATVIVQRGTLKKGDVLVAGTAMAKVRSLRDAEGKVMKEAGPGYPVEIDGWKSLPAAGEQVLEVDTEKQAREVVNFREEMDVAQKSQKEMQVITEKREQHQEVYREMLEKKRKLGRFKLKREGPRKPEIQEGDQSPSLNVIVKADVDGTLEAILDTLDTYESDDCKMDILHYDVGRITQNDIELAEPFNAVVYAFNVECPNDVKSLAESSNVSIKHFNVIYKLIDDIKDEINSRLPAKEVEEKVGEATVLQQFEINLGKKKIPVAGSKCVKGNLKRSGIYSLIRKGKVIFQGPLNSMRHLKNEVNTIDTDMECGLQLSDSNITFEKGDTLVCVERRIVTPKTDWDPGF